MNHHTPFDLEVVGVALALSMIPSVEAILRYESNDPMAKTADQLGEPCKR